MGSNAPRRGQQNGTADGHNSECSFQYTVPGWFLENIKTAEELNKTEIKIRLINKRPTNIDKSSEAMGMSSEDPSLDPTSEGRDHCFHVDHEGFEHLLDSVGSLQITDRMGRLSASQSTVQLSCSMRFGLEFLDELVALTVRELRSSLVQINAQDMEDMGLEFYYQEQSSQENNAAVTGSDDDGHEDDQEDDKSSNGIRRSNDNFLTVYESLHNIDVNENYDVSQIARNASRCYFGYCTFCDECRKTDQFHERRKDALLAVMNAAKSKALIPCEDVIPSSMVANSSEDLTQESSAVILYFRDGSTLFPPKPQHCRHYLRMTGKRRHGIQELVRQYRKAGESVIMIFAITHTDANEAELKPDPQVPWKVSECDCQCCNYNIPSRWIDPDITTISMMPLGVPTSWKSEHKTEWKGSLTASRIQSFKRRLSAQMSHFPCDPTGLLETRCDWFSLFPRSVTDQFSFVGFSTEVAVAFNHILARCSRKNKIDSNDVEKIILRGNGSIVPTTANGDDSHVDDGSAESGESEKSEDTNETEGGNPKVRYNIFERKHLAHVIEPDAESDPNFHAGLLDQDALANIKTVVRLWRYNVEHEPSSASWTKTQIALLYGAPGTGKTSLAREIARTLSLKLIVFNSADISLSRSSDELENYVQAIFSLAAKIPPSMILIDDVDFLLEDKRESRQYSLVKMFLSSLEESYRGRTFSFVLAATNHPWEVESSFLRSAHMIPVQLPRKEVRAQILNHFLKGESLDNVEIEEIAASTEGYSVAGLRHLCSQAVVAWASNPDSTFQEGSNVQRILSQGHFSEALRHVQPGISEKYLTDLKDFNRHFGIETSDTVQDMWTNFTPAIQKVLRWVNSQEPEESDEPFFYEKKFLSLIVNPKEMETSWSDLAVEQRTEQDLRRMINHHQNGSTSTGSYGLLRRGNTGGALVYGPPGTGKTQLARALAHECGMVAICATPADISSKWHGDGPKAIQGLFKLGKLLAPRIVFIDEADSLFPMRQSLHNQHEMVEVNQFLQEMDGLSPTQKNPFVLLATNRPAHLDSAVLRRVPNMFYFGLPGFMLRQRIFEILLKEEIVNSAVSIPILAAETSHFTGSDIKSLCIRVALSCDEAVKEDSEHNGKRCLTMRMFREVLGRVAPTATKAAIMAIRAFAKENHPDGIEQMQEFEVKEIEAKKIMVRNGMPEVEETAVPRENSSSSGSGSDDSQFALVLPSTPCIVPQSDTIQITPNIERVSMNVKSAIHTEVGVPMAYYDPLPQGGKIIRVLSITPREDQKNETLISCTLDHVNLEDWTAEYRSFRAMLPVLSENLRLIQNRALLLLWIGYNSNPELVQKAVKEGLSSFAANFPVQHLCDRPLERLPDLRDRYSWGDYIALSYVWGDQTNDKKILLNGKPFKVGLNLYHALECLSTSYEVRSRRLKVWIDAVCINQEDLGEREVEVRRMDLIYSRALAVRGWLGNPPDEVAAELPDFRSVLDAATRINQHNEIDFLEMEISDRKENTFEALILDEVQHNEDIMFSMWTAIDGIVGAPYWKRLWVTQEIILASSILFWYGEFYVTPEELCCLDWPGNKGSMEKLGPYIHLEKLLTTLINLKFVEQMLGWTRATNVMSLEEDRGQYQLLLKCIFHATRSQATDPRDKVYGILALLPPIMSSQIRPNYSPNFTWRDTWIEFTKICLQHQGNLNLLPRVSCIDSSFRNNLPSWALNFKTGEAEENMSASQTDLWGGEGHTRVDWLYGMGKILNNVYSLDLMDPCSSGTGLKPSFTFSEDGRSLSCMCVFVDQVSRVGQISVIEQMTTRRPNDIAVVQHDISDGRPCPKAKLSLSRAIMGKSTYQWEDGPSIFDVPWFSAEGLREVPIAPDEMDIGPNIRRSRDMFGVMDFKLTRDETEWTKDIPWTQILSQDNGPRIMFRDILHPIEHFRLRGATLRGYFDSEQDVCKDWSEMKSLIKRSYLVMLRNRISETRNGRVGWVTSIARPGDKIVILFGCDMPVVLRPRGGEYEVVGGCFIDGLMNGEVREEVESGILVPETITLC